MRYFIEKALREVSALFFAFFIDKNKYETNLNDHPHNKIYKVGIAFRGKGEVCLEHKIEE